MENSNLIAAPKRKTRRGLARKNHNTPGMENIPPEKVYNDHANDIINAKKQGDIDVQNKIKMLQSKKEPNIINSNLDQSQLSVSANNNTIVDVEFLKEPVPKITISPEIHGLLKDLEMTRASCSNDDKMEVDSEVEICEESFNEINEGHNFERESILVRVKYDNNKFHRLTLSMGGQFLAVMEEIGQLLNVPPSRILLSLNDNIVKPTDTPSSINLDVTKTIDAYITDDDTPSTFSYHDTAIDQEIEMLNLKIQTKDGKSKVYIQIKKTDRMLILMEKFAQSMEIKIEKLRFIFDGEEIQPTDTPENLGLEDGFCIDVGIKS